MPSHTPTFEYFANEGRKKANPESKAAYDAAVSYTEEKYPDAKKGSNHWVKLQDKLKDPDDPLSPTDYAIILKNTFRGYAPQIPGLEEAERAAEKYVQDELRKESNASFCPEI